MTLEIIPNLNKLMDSANKGIKIETYQDHRVAMSFGILGSYDLFGNGKPWLSIENQNVVVKHSLISLKNFRN